MFFSVFIAALATLAIGGCGNDQPATSGKQSPTAIVAASQHAAQHYISVLASGLVQDAGGRVRVDIHIEPGKGVMGLISDSPYTVDLIRIGQNIYLKSAESAYALNFYEQIAGRKIATRLLGRWIHASVDAGSLIRTLSSFTELPNLTRSFFGRSGKLSMVDRVGSKAVEVKNDATDEVLNVAPSGTPYPVRILRSGASTNEGIGFDQWNRPLPISAPPDPIDIKKIAAGE
jgi:hypothetical protein